MTNIRSDQGRCEGCNKVISDNMAARCRECRTVPCKRCGDPFVMSARHYMIQRYEQRHYHCRKKKIKLISGVEGSSEVVA